MLIVVEGKTKDGSMSDDEEFLALFCLHLNIDIPNFIQNGGNGLNDSTIEQIRKCLDNGEKVCIIFDADKSYTKSFNDIKNKLKENKEKFKDSVDKIDIFLFPNNKDDGEGNGELEDLLLKVAKKPYFIECFKRYETCIKSKNGNIFKKSKMYAYKEATGLEKCLKKLKDDKPSKDFLKIKKNIFKKYFDFNSLELKPLKIFLYKNLKTQPNII